MSKVDKIVRILEEDGWIVGLSESGALYQYHPPRNIGPYDDIKKFAKWALLTPSPTLEEKEDV